MAQSALQIQTLEFEATKARWRRAYGRELSAELTEAHAQHVRMLKAAAVKAQAVNDGRLAAAQARIAEQAATIRRLAGELGEERARRAELERDVDILKVRCQTERLSYVAAGSKAAEHKKAKTVARAELAKAHQRAQELQAEMATSEAAARAELIDIQQSLSVAEAAADSAVEKHARLRDLLPAVPGSYSEERFNNLDNDAQRQARSRARTFLLAVFRLSQFRIDDVSWVLSRLDWVEKLMGTPQFSRWFGEELRTMLAHCAGSLWGVNLGLWAHLVEKIPLRTIAKFRQAIECYDEATDSWVPRILWENPNDPNDVVPVPYTVPSPYALEPEIERFSLSFGLKSSADGKIAIQQLDLLVPHILTRDIGRQPPLEQFTSPSTAFNILLQGDSARRGIKVFCQWVFKNPYLDSQSALMLHLWALGLRVKDGQKGAREAWGEQAAALEALDGSMVPMGGLSVYLWLTVTVDLHAERDLGGVINGGCACQDYEQHHAVPCDRRKRFTGNLPDILEYIYSVCRDHTLEEQITLSHSPHAPGELPRPCPAEGCDVGHGAPEKVRAEFAAATAKYEKLAAESEKSDAGRQAFNKEQLDHAHAHMNVRWMARGVPVPKVPKSRFWLELLHSLPINCCKLQVP